jgi:hypothetical protein
MGCVGIKDRFDFDTTGSTTTFSACLALSDDFELHFLNAQKRDDLRIRIKDSIDGIVDGSHIGQQK